MSRFDWCGALALSVWLLGCAVAPLGADWEELSPAQRDARARDALRDLFAGGVDGAGAATIDREVLACDEQGVAYALPGRPGRISRLAWRDVSSVETQPHDDLPSRPETLYIYLRPQSPSLDTVEDLTRPALASTGLFSPYVELRSRPRWSRNRLLAALSQLTRPRAAEAPGVAPVTSPTATQPDSPDAAEPPGEGLDAVEAKLRRLKAWREQGLIDEAEYEQKRKQLLEGL